MMDGVPIRKLFVRNFANRTTSEDLCNYFSKYGNVESCCLRGNQGKSNCAFVTFTNVADAVRAMQDRNRKRIHNRDLRVMAAAFWLQPGGMEQYFHNHLQNDTESVSIHMLNDDCLRHIFVFLPIADRVRIEIVCKRWRVLSQDSWRMIKTLDLSHSMWDFSNIRRNHTDLLNKILLKYGKFLTQINLYDPNDDLSESSLTDIWKHWPNLTSIDVIGMEVYPSGIRTFANNCRNITKFSLGPSTDSCDNELKYFFELNQKLEYLEIKYNDISGESLLCLPEQTMHTIILYRCYYLQNEHLSMALKRLENLKSLAIYTCSGITERTLEVVGQHCKNLRALELADFPPMTDMSYLFHLVDLQILKILRHPQVTDGFLADLVKHCQQLTLLNIKGCRKVSDAGLMAVARLVKLEKLYICNNPQVTDDGLKNICGLKELACANCKFTNRGMSRFIKSSPQLQLLNFYGCRNITDTTLEVVKHVCSNRTNNVMLRVIVNGTAISTIGQERLPPLLHIV